MINITDTHSLSDIAMDLDNIQTYLNILESYIDENDELNYEEKRYLYDCQEDLYMYVKKLINECNLAMSEELNKVVSDEEFEERLRKED